MSEELTLVYGGMLEDAVGPGHGLRVEALEAIGPRVEQGLDALDAKRDAGEIGFFDVPCDRTTLPEIAETSARLRRDYRRLFVLGIGGSALGATALVRALTPAFAAADGAMEVRCLDNVDPAWFAEALRAFPLEESAFVVVSKSGRTPETLSQYLVVRELLRERLPEDWRRRVVIVTDPAKGPLRDEAARIGADSFPIHGNVGGRFSVLTPVGLLPAAAAGIDVEALLDGAKRAQERCESRRLAENPGAMLGALLFLADRDLGMRNHVLMPYRQALWETAFWFRQLWAESLGKSEKVGPTPIAALGTTDQHSQMQLYMEGPRDKIIMLLEIAESGETVPLPEGGAPDGLEFLNGKSVAELFRAEILGTRSALLAAGRPVLTIRLPRLDAAGMGGLLQTFMVATAVAGELYGIDAFDQPGVEAGKINAAALLGKAGLEETATSLREAAEQIERSRV